MRASQGQGWQARAPALFSRLSGAMAASLILASLAGSAAWAQRRPPARGGQALPVRTAPVRPPIPAMAAPLSNCPASSTFPSTIRTAYVVKAFPEVVWNICVQDMGGRTIWIGPVDMVHVPTGIGLRVIDQAGLAEIFTTTHDGATRHYELHTSVVGPQHAGPNGTILLVTDQGDPQVYHPTMVAETRDRGIAWLCKQTTAVTRRAQEFVIWGVSSGGNDRTVIEYAFRDDGVITFRAGHTGYNAPADPFEPHAHDALWYVHRGAPQSPYWLTHLEPSPPTSPTIAQDLRTPIAVEDSRQWNERELATLLLEGNVANAFGNMIGYEFSPLQNSLTRHFGPQESWTQNDVSVTRSRPSELGWIANGATPDNYLLTYLNGESVANADLALWIKTAAHHHPNDEDRSGADASGGMTGITLIRWSGFRMEPHNLFNANPMGGPARCGP